MLGKKTLRRMTVGMLAAACSAIALPPAASASETYCSPYNSQYDVCQVWDWYTDPQGNTVWGPVGTYFRLRENNPHIDP